MAGGLGQGVLAAGEAAGPGSWGPVLALLVIAAAFGAGTVAVSALFGRRRTGPVKDMPYESGMAPAGLARRRFSVRYYLLAILFLLFDVEVVLLFPWAVIFGGPGGQRDGALLAEMFLFIGILLVGYVYAWRRGVLQFD